MNIYIPFSLKLYAYGLEHLNDYKWARCDFFQYIKECVKYGKHPKDLLRKTLKEGLLFELGGLFFDEYLRAEDDPCDFTDDYAPHEKLDFFYFCELEDDYSLWYLETIYELLKMHGVDSEDKLFLELAKKLQYFDKLYDENEDLYYDTLEVEYIYLCSLYYRLYQHFESRIFDKIRSIYAGNFGERAFHDRQLCQYISQLLIRVGWGGSYFSEDDKDWQWIDRPKNWPAWVMRTLISREGNRCANCKGYFLILKIIPL